MMIWNLQGHVCIGCMSLFVCSRDGMTILQQSLHEEPKAVASMVLVDHLRLALEQNATWEMGAEQRNRMCLTTGDWLE